MSYQITVILCFVLFAIVSYLLGSINFAIITTKRFTGKDVRDSGSGNAGMTNVMRTAGFLPGVLTFVGDFVKALAACALGKFALTPLITALAPAAVDQTGFFAVSELTPIIGSSLAGMFCILGHIFPVFYGFRGGKGIVTAAGTMVILDPRIFLLEVAIFALVFLCSRIISLGSLTAAVCYPFVSYLCLEVFSPMGKLNTAACTMANPPLSAGWIASLGALVVAIGVILKHKGNIIRLIHKEEAKLVLKKNK